MDKDDNRKNIIMKNADNIDALIAFTEAQIVSNQQLKVIADNTTYLKEYFKESDGFDKKLGEHLDAKLSILTKNLTIKFFAIVSSIAVILGAVVALIK